MKRILFTISLLIVALLTWAQPKYIFYFIGDGMGQNQVLLTEMYLAQIKGEIGRQHLCMTTFPVASSASNFSKSNSITDSSAAGTCLASGSKTINGRLGLDENGKHHPTVAEVLHNHGWAVGVTTSVSIDHATPAAFYAAVEKRGDYHTIATQLPKSEFEFFGGSSFIKPVNEKDANSVNAYKLCENAGYTIVRGVKEYQEKSSKSKRIILVQEGEAIDYTKPGRGNLPVAIDAKKEDLTLEQITASAIDFLSKDGRPFFLEVEGGEIDWLCHANDAAGVIHEVMDFDRAIMKAYEFYLQHPEETLILVTADHETGGLSLTNGDDYVLHLDVLQHQKMSAGAISARLGEIRKTYGKKLTFDQVKDYFSETLGLFTTVEVSAAEEAALKATFKLMMKNKDKDVKNLYSSINSLSDQAVRLLAKKAHVSWTGHSHSAAPVPVYAIGAGAEYFSTFNDIADFAPTLIAIATGKEVQRNGESVKIQEPQEMKVVMEKVTRLKQK